MEIPVDFDVDERRLAVLGECAITAHVDFEKRAGKPCLLHGDEAVVFSMTDPDYAIGLVDRLCLERHIMVRLLEMQLAGISDDATKFRVYEKYKEFDALAAAVAGARAVCFSKHFSIETLTSCILRDKTGYTPLMDACRKQLDKSAAIAILRSDISQVDQVSRTGCTALIYACHQARSEQIIRLLVETGKSKPGQICKGGHTALTTYCKHDISRVEIVKLLLATGESRPGHVTHESKTALIYAAECMSHATIIEILKTGKSKPGHKIGGKTAISIIAQKALHERKSHPHRRLYRDFMAAQKGLKK